MSRTITAMFDTKSDAEAGRERLLAADLNTDNVIIHDQSAAGQTGEYSSSEEPGMWASIKNAFLPDEDRHTYEEGVRRGGFLLTADVDDAEVDGAVAALEDANCVDIDERSQEWKSEGWKAPVAGAMFGSGGSDKQSSGSDKQSMSRAGTADHLDVVEEQLIVGKREVERGGVRVRSYVTEVPVHEQVRLRQEHVEVERRPVDRDLSASDGDAFSERSIELTETSEEAVVGKKARVVEEIALKKSSDERVEEINETVRKTKVDVENLSGTDRSIQSDQQNLSSNPGREASTGAKGMGNEAMGNAKQALGGMTGNDELKNKGLKQERSGEMQQGKKPEGSR